MEGELKDIKAIASTWIPATLGIFVLFFISKYMIEREVFWMDAFRKGQFSNDCQIEVLNIPASDPLDRGLKGESIDSRSLKIPLRTNSPFANLKLPPNIQVRVLCDWKISDIDRSRQLWLSLGSVLNRLGLWVNGVNIYHSDEEYYFPVLPLPPAPPDHIYHLTIIGVTNSAGIFSLGSRIPLVFHDSYRNYQNVLAYIAYKSHDFALISLSISVGLAALFVTTWIFGIRYMDTFWMSSALLINAVFSIISWDNSINIFLQIGLINGIYSSLALGICGFLRLRLSMKKQLTIFITPIAIAILMRLLPISLYRNYIQAFMYVSIFSYLASISIRETKVVQGHRKNMLRVGTTIMILAACAFFTTGLLLEVSGIYLWDTIAPILLLVFASIFSVDLVMFHRGFKVANKQAETERQRREFLEQSMELGLTMQKMLMEPTAAEPSSRMKLSVHFEAMEGMAGDWILRNIHDKGVSWLAIGDVVGKGPQAAVAATSILTTIKIAARQTVNVTAALEWADHQLYDSFSGAISSTIAAIIWDEDYRRVSFISNGSACWLRIRGEDIRAMEARGPNLGSGKMSESVFSESDMISGDIFVVFSDGIIDGSRDISRAVKRLKNLAKTQNIHGKDVQDLLLDISRKTSIHDDKTIAVLQFK